MSARQPVVVAVFVCAVLLCAWIVFIQAKNPPADHRISNVALSNSGRWLAAGTASGNITIWDQTRTAAPKQIAFPRGSLNDLQFSPDEQLLTIASRDLGLYDLSGADTAAPRLIRSDHANYGSARFSRDGHTLLTITGAGVIETLDAHSGALRVSVCCSTIYGDAVFTPDGRQIANAGHWPRLWDAASGRLVAPLAADREIETLRPIAFDPVRHTILMGSQDGRVYVWDLESRQRIAVSPAQPGYVDTLLVSANGWVIFAGFGKDVQIWNPDTGEKRSLPAARPTSNLVLASDGMSIVFGTANGQVEWWDTRTGQRLRSVPVPGISPELGHPLAALLCR